MPSESPDPPPARPATPIPGEPPAVILRLLAYAVDCALLAAVLIPVHYFLVLRTVMGDARPEWTHDGFRVWLFVLATWSMPVWLYFTAFERAPWRATPAKRLFGMVVVGPRGERIRTRDALLRTAVKLLPWELCHAALMLPVPLWDADHADVVSRPLLFVQFFLTASWLVTLLLTPGNRGVHDLVARTFVVRRPQG